MSLPLKFALKFDKVSGCTVNGRYKYVLQRDGSALRLLPNNATRISFSIADMLL